MTNKNESAEVMRIQINQKTLDLPNPTARPARYEVETLDDGTIIVIKRAVPATVRRSE
jgi:hypothetical protein